MTDIRPETVAELRAFLAGSGPLDGHWFGDDVKPRFWWRKHLSRIDALAARLAEVEASERKWMRYTLLTPYEATAKLVAAEAEVARLKTAQGVPCPYPERYDRGECCGGCALAQGDHT